ncbi:MAG: hypothetical protein M3449_01200 [Acidobacteriota bacterium]|nr:hypothetical protein [Blastocatellia bacterium]MDQ3489672.1 hypothetical protein [Acidobacteriota bacterium]
MKIGEAIEVPRPKTTGEYPCDYYRMGKTLRFRVSVRTIDIDTVRLTRVE